MILDKMKLNGKVAIVTGGTSGIGEAIAHGLAEAGAYVVPVSRTAEKVEETVCEIKKFGSKALGITADITQPDSVDNLLEVVMEKLGKVDILVNNAGTRIKKPLLDQSLEDWYEVIDLNLTAVFTCCKKIGSQMVKQRDGRIINIASIASRFAIVNALPYCASKGGLLQLTRTLSAEWAEYNIRVNAIAPGYFETPLTKGILQNKDFYNSIMNRVPMRRVGQIDELQGVAVFLASDASSYITGEVIYVDGGFAAAGV